MAFWAIGKVKNITQKLNLKQYKQLGTNIIKNYIQKQQANDQFFDFKQSSNIRDSSRQSKSSASNNKQRYTNEEWMKIQIQEYKKLQNLQQRLLKRHEDQQKQRLEKEYLELQNELKKLNKQEQEQQQIIEKQKLKISIKNGEKDIKQLIKENILMRQQIQKQKVFQNAK